MIQAILNWVSAIIFILCLALQHVKNDYLYVLPIGLITREPILSTYALRAPKSIGYKSFISIVSHSLFGLLPSQKWHLIIKSSGEYASPNLSNYMPYEVLFPKFHPIEKSLRCCVWNKHNFFHGSWNCIMCLLSFKGTKSYISTEQSSTCSLL